MEKEAESKRLETCKQGIKKFEKYSNEVQENTEHLTEAKTGELILLKNLKKICDFVVAKFPPESF